VLVESVPATAPVFCAFHHCIFAKLTELYNYSEITRQQWKRRTSYLIQAKVSIWNVTCETFPHQLQMITKLSAELILDKNLKRTWYHKICRFHRHQVQWSPLRCSNYVKVELVCLVSESISAIIIRGCYDEWQSVCWLFIQMEIVSEALGAKSNSYIVLLYYTSLQHAILHSMGRHPCCRKSWDT
jgi:hypothetical protein